ncbi:MAG: fumarylacetoacetate hydrolase family protein, partial [Pseudomonadales bacterium]|nr:fumarylacetoacetate hydrolase family protein [Pseudomonadales bacterium]
DRRNDHEVELAVIIGKTGTNISYDDAMDHNAGYAIGLDMTVRGTEDRSVRKSLDTYSVLGPWFVTKDEIADPDDLDFWITVNNEIRQKSNTSQLIYDVRKQIEYFSSFYTLVAGDVIMTGTPAGVGPLNVGDELVLELTDVSRFDSSVR